jgi:hypothetical protein
MLGSVVGKALEAGAKGIWRDSTGKVSTRWWFSASSLCLFAFCILALTET